VQDVVCDIMLGSKGEPVLGSVTNIAIISLYWRYYRQNESRRYYRGKYRDILGTLKIS
jgi:hypothetical protein